MNLRTIIKAALVFTLSVVLIVVIGIAGMLGFTAVTFFQDREDTTSMMDIDAALVQRNGTYTFEAPAILEDNHRWAMLIDNHGTISWSQDLPDDVPLRTDGCGELHPLVLGRLSGDHTDSRRRHSCSGCP